MALKPHAGTPAVQVADLALGCRRRCHRQPMRWTSIPMQAQLEPADVSSPAACIQCLPDLTQAQQLRDCRCRGGISQKGRLRAAGGLA